MPSFKPTIAAYLPLIAIILLIESTAGELRPSDHGLEYQSLPPTATQMSSEMRSFFGSTSSSSSSNALPKAVNSTDSSWSRGRSDHIRRGLLVAALGCGAAGLALLVASAVMFVSRIRSSSSRSANSATNNGLVVFSK